MSRIGRLPIPIPAGVKVEVEGQTVRVTGPKGTLQRTVRPEVHVEVNDGKILVTRVSDKKEHRALHGLTRALINNMVIGVTQGFEKVLLIEGVGYRAAAEGKDKLTIAIGYSHPVVVQAPQGITFAVDNPQTIRVSGIDKELVGQVAADIRAIRRPEPYKGKGIRYQNEMIRRKEGKSGGK